MNMPELVYRLVNDEALRNLMQMDVEEAVVAAGAVLSREELDALAALSWDTSLFANTQGPDQWWVRQLNHCPIQVRLSTPA